MTNKPHNRTQNTVRNLKNLQCSIIIYVWQFSLVSENNQRCYENCYSNTLLWQWLLRQWLFVLPSTSTGHSSVMINSVSKNKNPMRWKKKRIEFIRKKSIENQKFSQSPNFLFCLPCVLHCCCTQFTEWRAHTVEFIRHIQLALILLFCLEFCPDN